MKTFLWTTMIMAATAAETALADPTITAQSFQCEFRSRVDGPWEKRGAVSPDAEGYSLLLRFEPSNEGSALDQLGTTNTGFEFRVEARCPGSITLTNDRPFRIRDFIFKKKDAFIGSNQGLIELKVKGQTTVTSTNQKDSFEKDWRIRLPDLEKEQGFTSQQESTTVCGQKLTLKFDDLRGMVMIDEDSGSATQLSLESLNVNFDPC